MTERLYYHDSRQTSFEATILRREDVGESGGAPRMRVLLDRSAFYPASGGQPADHGTLAGAQLLDVVAETDNVWHYVLGSETFPDTGAMVRGVIDRERRFDLMQQHSAQHLLSQVFVRLCGCETLSVHMGEAESTIDFDAQSLAQSQLDDAEAEANRLVWQALPVLVYFVEGDEIARVPLRKPPKVSGLVRIVEIAGFDWSACGGTHVATTAELAPILITHSERRRGGTRITFMAGGRALRQIAQSRSLLNEAASLFSTDVADVPLLITRSQERVKELQRALDALREQLLGVEAQTLLLAAQNIGDIRLVITQRSDLDAAGVRTFASILAAQPQVVALVASEQEGKLLLAFARNAATTPDSLHMGDLLRDTLAQSSGKGGGRPEFAQGGGVPAEEAEVLLAWATNHLGTK